jgi:DNA polymerase IV (DinB-like DNA polymerase)
MNGGWTENRKVIVCVDLNAFYPSCEELRDPSLRGKPHAVIMTDQKAGEITKGVVSSCSYEARRYGIKSAMSLSKAQSLCPSLILLPVDIEYYGQISNQVMTLLEEFATIVEQASIDEAYLDCTSEIKKEGCSDTAIEELGNKIKQAIKEKCNGLSCSVGIAPTKSAAKIACDYKKPDGLTVVTPSNLKSFLSSLEVNRVAGIGPKTEQALKGMGITTLGQLAESDVSRLMDRFGKNGMWMWKVSNGTDEEYVQPRGDHISLSTEYTLDNPTRDKEKVRQFLYELVDEIYGRANRHGYQFRTVGVKLVRANNFAVETRETTFAYNQNSRNAIESSIEPLLNKFSLSNDKPAIRKVGLKISHLFKQNTIAAPAAATNIPELNKVQIVQKTLFDYFNNNNSRD